jgi:hypothetical protein
MVSVPATQDECLRCKGGKLLCGLTYCPIILRSKALIPLRKALPKFKNNYYGPSPPGVFIGRFGYPKVRIGPMAAVGAESVEIIDEPDSWRTNMSMEDIINFRGRLLRFVAEPINVNSASSPSRLIEITQEQVQSSIPVDLEIKFNKAPKINMRFDRFTQPMGARVQVSNLQLASSPKIPHQTDKIVTDTDLASIQAVSDLYASNHTVTQITRLFSSGLLGLKKSRKFVPTRWSITAVDDILGNRLRLKIQDNPSIDSFQVYHNSYLDNDFWIVFMPKHEWFFDYHESWKQKSAWNLLGKKPRIYSDYEGPKGRSSYATNTLGGYYAARLAVLEKLNELRRKAAVIAFREVGKGYSIPLGVWQVRENMREALKVSKSFNTLETALKYISPHLTIPMKYYHYQSPLLNRPTLDKFIPIPS